MVLIGMMKEKEDGSIGELTTLLSLERLHFVACNSTELSTFLGPLMRTKLKELYVQSYQASELIPLLNLMPNLKILEIGTCDELGSLYPLVTTIEKLTLNYSIRLLQHFQDMQNDLSFKDNKSFQLAHLTIRGQRKIVNFSILSHIPATVSVLILEFNSKNSLAGALESLMEGQIQFKKLQVKLVTFDRSESDDEEEEPLVDNVEFDLNSEWERVIVECKRFGVAVERIL